MPIPAFVLVASAASSVGVSAGMRVWPAVFGGMRLVLVARSRRAITAKGFQTGATG
jgi:hypothetical protein